MYSLFLSEWHKRAQLFVLWWYNRSSLSLQSLEEKKPQLRGLFLSVFQVLPHAWSLFLWYLVPTVKVFRLHSFLILFFSVAFLSLPFYFLSLISSLLSFWEECCALAVLLLFEVLSKHQNGLKRPKNQTWNNSCQCLIYDLSGFEVQLLKIKQSCFYLVLVKFIHIQNQQCVFSLWPVVILYLFTY